MRLATRFFIQLVTACDRAERSAPAGKYGKHARAGRVLAHGLPALRTTTSHYLVAAERGCGSMSRPVDGLTGTNGIMEG